MYEFFGSEFQHIQDIPPRQHYHDVPRVPISEKGFVSMNRAFRKEVGTQRDFRSQITPDGRYLVLYPMETPNIHFSAKGGNATHLDLAKYLAEKGILLPANYSMAWCKERQAWVGCCGELAQPPAPSVFGKGKKKAAEKRKA